MKTILVVDDTPALLAFVATVLKAGNHAPLQANSGEHALEIASRTPNLDALVTDIRMPGINGFELAKVVRRDRPDIPILFISGYFDSDEIDHMDWMRAGNVSFLPKPFQPGMLLQQVDNLLALRKPLPVTP